MSHTSFGFSLLCTKYFLHPLPLISPVPKKLERPLTVGLASEGKLLDKPLSPPGEMGKCQTHLVSRVDRLEYGTLAHWGGYDESERSQGICFYRDSKCDYPLMPSHRKVCTLPGSTQTLLFRALKVAVSDEKENFLLDALKDRSNWVMTEALTFFCDRD